MRDVEARLALAFIHLAFIHLAFIHLAFIHLAFIHLAFIHLAFIHLAFIHLAFIHLACTCCRPRAAGCVNDVRRPLSIGIAGRPGERDMAVQRVGQSFTRVPRARIHGEEPMAFR